MNTSEFLDNFYKRMIKENIRISLALMEPAEPVDKDVEAQTDLLKESITIAFINPSVAALFTAHTWNSFTYREVKRITNIVKAYIDYYDAVKTHYLFRSDVYEFYASEDPPSLLEMKTLFSETYNAVCESRGIEPTDAHDLRINEVPPLVTYNLRRYVAMFRGVIPIPTDLNTHYQMYKQLLVCILGVFEIYHKLREQGYEPEE